MSLDLSLGEFAALTGKALRGVGYPWGLATDGAYAARTLAQSNFPAGAIMARLLDARSSTEYRELTDPLCPLWLGAALADLGDRVFDEGAALIADRIVLEPLLVAPALTNCIVRWHSGQAERIARHVVLAGEPPMGPTSVAITRLDSTAPPLAALNTRAVIDAASHNTLLAYAARTYAPATEESRNSGAG